MKMAVFANRNRKEMLRDPLNVAFGIGFPVIVLLLLSLISANAPEAPFHIKTLAPGIAVFGHSFIALFSGMLIAKDRSSSFLMRLYASPMRPMDYILGYTLPLIPLALGQSVMCFLTAFALGLAPTIHVLMALLVMLPSALLYIGIGLLAGSALTDKQVGGICGALLTNLTAWLSGAWFDVGLVGGVFEGIARALPFVHAVDAARAALSGNYAAIFPSLWWVIGYAAVILALASVVFRRKMTAVAA